MPTRKPKAITDVRSLARSYTETAIKTLAAIAGSKKAADSARVAASTALLDRGWGKAPQALTGPDGGPVIINIKKYAGD